MSSRGERGPLQHPRLRAAGRSRASVPFFCPLSYSPTPSTPTKGIHLGRRKPKPLQGLDERGQGHIPPGGHQGSVGRLRWPFPEAACAFSRVWVRRPFTFPWQTRSTPR